MSDLISRSQLLKEIEAWGGCVEALHEYIQNMPTAYDIDKVIRELRRASGNGYRDIDGDYVPPMIETEKAIEIVKKSIRKDISE